MEASHARPMTAYAALCAAAVVVLAQGARTTTPVTDAIAQAGPPAALIAPRATLTAAERLTERVTDLGTAIVGSLVPVAAEAHQRAALAAGDTVVGGRSQRAATTSVVVEPVRIEPATRQLSPAPTTSSTKANHRASTDRKADRAAARDARKADRAAAKDARKHHRATRHHHR